MYRENKAYRTLELELLSTEINCMGSFALNALLAKKGYMTIDNQIKCINDKKELLKNNAYLFEDCKSMEQAVYDFNESNKGLTEFKSLINHLKEINPDFVKCEKPLIEEAINQLTENIIIKRKNNNYYFNKPNPSLTLRVLNDYMLLLEDNYPKLINSLKEAIEQRESNLIVVKEELSAYQQRFLHKDTTIKKLEQQINGINTDLKELSALLKKKEIRKSSKELDCYIKKTAIESVINYVEEQFINKNTDYTLTPPENLDESLTVEFYNCLKEFNVCRVNNNQVSILIKNDRNGLLSLIKNIEKKI
ncbi:MAG: hypothetical protein WC307_03495 [Candidatus Nanoarchaeia archaeon]|jgi:hypothetical protein